MATHSSVLAWRIPGTGKPGGLPSSGHTESDMTEVTQHSITAFFTVQLSHPYVTTGKTIALTRWTFVGKVISLCFNMLSRLIVGFLPRSKCLLIPWLQSPSAVILEPKIIKFVTVKKKKKRKALNKLLRLGVRISSPQAKYGPLLVSVGNLGKRLGVFLVN